MVSTRHKLRSDKQSICTQSRACYQHLSTNKCNFDFNQFDTKLTTVVKKKRENQQKTQIKKRPICAEIRSALVNIGKVATNETKFNKDGGEDRLSIIDNNDDDGDLSFKVYANGNESNHSLFIQMEESSNETANCYPNNIFQSRSTIKAKNNYQKSIT